MSIYIYTRAHTVVLLRRLQVRLRALDRHEPAYVGVDMQICIYVCILGVCGCMYIHNV